MMGRYAAALVNCPLRMNGEGLLGSVELAGGQIHVALLHGARNIVNADAARGKRVGIHLDAHGVFLRAVHENLGNSAHLRDALGEQCFGVLVHGVKGKVSEVRAR